MNGEPEPPERELHAKPRPTEKTTFIASLGLGEAVQASGGSLWMKLSVWALGVLPSATSWMVDQWKHYWPAFQRVPKRATKGRRSK